MTRTNLSTRYRAKMATLIAACLAFSCFASNRNSDEGLGLRPAVPPTPFKEKPLSPKQVGRPEKKSRPIIPRHYNFTVNPASVGRVKLIQVIGLQLALEKLESDTPSEGLFFGHDDTNAYIIHSESGRFETYAIPDFVDLCYSRPRKRFAAIDTELDAIIEYDERFVQIARFRLPPRPALHAIRPFSATRYLVHGDNFAGVATLSEDSVDLQGKSFATLKPNETLGVKPDKRYFVSIGDFGARFELDENGAFEEVERRSFYDEFHNLSSNPPLAKECVFAADIGLLWRGGYWVDVGAMDNPLFYNSKLIPASISSDGRLCLTFVPDGANVNVIRVADAFHGAILAETPTPLTASDANSYPRHAGFFPDGKRFWFYTAQGFLTVYAFDRDRKKSKKDSAVDPSDRESRVFMIEPPDEKERK